MSGLAILGGTPVLRQPLLPYHSMGARELEAVTEVIQSGCLSGFYGNWGSEFLGGPKVKRLEEEWCRRFRVKHAVSVNSATSGLFAAMGAVGIGPGDEVIVPPYTMSATAMAPLVYGGIPVFVDIEPSTFCLDIRAVRRAITPRTRAILAVNLFGHPAPLAELLAIAQEHNLKLIEDSAQAPLAAESDRLAGTVGHIGVFSLNYHKHIHCGEGGVCVSNDNELALRLQLIRNHAENCVEALGLENLTNLIGFNYRLTELSAAVALEQLARIDDLVGQREKIAAALTEAVRDLEGLQPPVVRNGCRHAYYVWALRFNEPLMGMPRALFSRALRAEGFPHFEAYVRPLYLLPVFQRRIALGPHGYPFKLTNVDYSSGLCPVAERMWSREFIGFETCAHNIDEETLARLGEALRKVHRHRNELAAAADRVMAAA